MLLHLKSFTMTGFLVGGRSKILQRLSSTMSGDNPIVDVPGLGKLKGTLSQTAWTGKNIFQFQGVRYAEPAVGDKRFKVHEC
jgi:acetylcholinesterase